MKLLRKILFETERNSFSIVSRKTFSAAAALTASMPLIASIWCELYLPWLSSTLAKRAAAPFARNTSARRRAEWSRGKRA